MDELTRKINMWRIALEERNANMGVMQVFDSMLVFMGEQQRENERLEKQLEGALFVSDYDYKPEPLRKLKLKD